MRSRRFRPHEPDQSLLLPQTLGDWLPEDHIVFFVRDAEPAGGDASLLRRSSRFGCEGRTGPGTRKGHAAPSERLCPMKPIVSLTLTFALLILRCVDQPADAGQPVVDRVVGPDHPAWGCLKDVPVYVQEWHVWWGFPYPDPERPFRHMSSTMTPFLEPWRLEWDRNGYPLVGLYDATNIEVARWQMRCMKACGLTSAAVMLHPTAADEGGLKFSQEGPGWKGFIPRLLDAAAAQGFPVFFMDEVAFMQGAPREPEVMTRRVIRFLKKYGSHPGFYRIDGKPVYYYQTFGYWLGEDVTRAMMDAVEREVGPVHWMIFGGVGGLVKVPNVASIVCGASTHFQDRTTRRWDWDRRGQDVQAIVATAHRHGKRATNLNHVKYENTSQPWRPPGVPMYGYRGERLVRIVRDALDAKSDFIMLSSWNDWEEGTNLEPGWDVDGFAGDPYLYCRVLAGMRGIKFVPPPPPPRRAVHPTIWEKLGYGDGAGPMIERVRRTHQRGGGFEIVVRDSASAVTRLEVAWNGDLYWYARQPGQEKTVANVDLAAGVLAESETLRSPINPRFQIGNACTMQCEELRFMPSRGAPDVGETPAVGVVYALDVVEPLAGLQAVLSLRPPAARRERDGSRTIALRLAPHNKPEDIGAEAWEGWHARVAVPPAPVRVGPGHAVALRANSATPSPRRIAHFSLLGPPREERMHKAAPIPVGGSVRIVRFYVPISVERLETPGLQCVWFRAQDAAGCWGSPRLVPVPNYEFPGRAAPEEPVDGEWRRRTGAVFACRFETDETNWNKVFPPGGRGGGKRCLERRIVENRYYKLSNYVVYSTFQQPVSGSFRLRAEMLHTKSPRAGILWLTTAGGNAGYGVCWGHHGSARDGGEGLVNIVSFAKKEGDVEFHEKTMRKLTRPVRSGHKATTPPLAEIELTYDTDARELSLSVDGTRKGTAKDVSPLRLERIYLRGNDTILFDDIEVVPR